MGVTRGRWRLRHTSGLHAGTGDHRSFSSSSQLVKHLDDYAGIMLGIGRVSVIARSVSSLIGAKEVHFAKRGGGGGKCRSHRITLRLLGVGTPRTSKVSAVVPLHMPAWTIKRVIFLQQLKCKSFSSEMQCH